MVNNEAPPPLPVMEPPPFQKPRRASKRESSKAVLMSDETSKPPRMNARSSKTHSTSRNQDRALSPEKSSRLFMDRLRSSTQADRSTTEGRSKKSTKMTTEAVTTEKMTSERASKRRVLGRDTMAEHIMLERPSNNKALATKTLTEKEVRSLQRKERRAREPKLKLKEAALQNKDRDEEEESSSEEEDDDSGGDKINANLSNQNNVTVNVPGIETVGQAMGELTKLVAKAMGKSEEKSKKTKSKKNMNEISKEGEEEEEEVITNVRKAKVKKKTREPSESEESADGQLVASEFAKRLVKAEKTFRKDQYEAVDMSYFQQRRKRPGKPRIGLSQEMTITTKMIREWIKTSDKSFWQIFWEILYSYPPEDLLHVLAIMSEWADGTLNDLAFAASLWEVKAYPGRNALAWFLTQYHETPSFLRWLIFDLNGGRDALYVPRGEFVFVDPLEMISPRQVKMELLSMQRREELEAMGYNVTVLSGDNPFT